MVKIWVAGIQHETNTFSPIPTTLTQFQQADSWPAWVEGDAVLTSLKGKAIPLAGFVQQAMQLGYDCVPGLWCSATPSGCVTADAFDCLSQRLLHCLGECVSEIEAVYLDLHGAMVSEVARDADGVLLQLVRQLVGPDCWVMATLDCHANVTQLMVDNADVLLSYRTYPHVDIADTGARLARVFDVYCQRGTKPAKAFHAFEFLIPMTAQCSLVEPAKHLFAECDNIETDAGVALSFNPGFPLADTVDTGPTVLSYASTSQQAAACLRRMVTAVQARQQDFIAPLFTPEQAIEWVESQGELRGPVVFADTQDNPGCGGSGDTTGILRALLLSGVTSALVAMIFDPQSAEKAFAAGVGATVSLQLGEGSGVTGLLPLQVVAQVQARREQPILATGAFYRGCHLDVGKVVRLRIRHVDVIVGSCNLQAADQALLRELGADPLSYAVIALKSSVHFRADFQSLAHDVLVVRSPGLNQADLTTLSYRYLREGVSIE